MSLLSWQIEWAGLVMGDGTPYVIQSMTGLNDTPGVRSSDSARARAHGAWAGTDYSDVRSITATISVDGPHPNSALWDALSRALVIGQPGETPLTVKVPGLAQGRELIMFARCRNLSLPTDQDYASGVGAAAVQWVATDPRIYAATESTLTVGIASSSASGFPFPLTFPISFGGAATGGLVTANNEGEFPAPWVATIHGPVVGPRIENVTTGETLTFNGSLAAGETLVVSSADASVLLNGVASRYPWLAFGSQWFDLAPGVNELRFAGTSGTGSLDLVFRSAWI